MPFIHDNSTALRGKMLIIPIISSANVAQLSIDLLINSLGLVRFAILDSQYFIPLTGSREDGQPGITTPFELFGKDGLDFVIIQQRSPTLKVEPKKQEFIDDLFKFVEQSGFNSVLILSGVDSSNRSDEQMLTPTFQLQPNELPLSSTQLHRLVTFPIPKYTSPVPQKPSEDGEPRVPFIPGGGIARRVLSSMPARWDIPIAALLRFALDGDNRADAYSLASIVAQVAGINIQTVAWRQPESWVGLFGTPHDQSLY
ncbi:hypothetical protein D9757_000789 [Collybiopsis confluens]|uniref:Proteasome assembly chaperone 2 n=1 Tax=Collybiopsis confluens TaxID=2823264 RepID=A0A8H5I1Y7_9AGAR|nr:hypothetical protein D9757_000789 [Collybiopsis confluens]